MAQPLKSICVRWDDTNTYTFYIKYARRTPDSNQGVIPSKDVYIGYFSPSAPENLKVGELYCLKIVYAHGNRNEETQSAQSRERYDICNFGGAHIRKILACNSNTEHIRSQLEQSGDCDELANCCTVEPCYAIVPDENNGFIQSMTPWERLEFICQYAQALLELQKCRINGHQIIAHRDVKVSNAMILQGVNQFTLKLNDLSSIRFPNDPNAPYTPNAVFLSNSGVLTIHIPASRENTAPEHVLERYPTTEKVDVYALGMMLASFFGCCEKLHYNPNVTWCSTACGWNVNPTDPTAFNKLVNKVKEEFSRWAEFDHACTAPGNSWIEQALSEQHNGFCWNNSASKPHGISDTVLQQIQEVFYHATRIDPAKRLSLSEFLQRVRRLQTAIPQKRSSNGVLYRLPISTFLYDLRSTGTQMLALELATTQAYSLGGPLVRCMTYCNPGDNLEKEERPTVSERIYATESDLLGSVSSLLPADGTGNGTLTEALWNLNAFYTTNKTQGDFNGRIHIFTTMPLTDRALPPITQAGELISYESILVALCKMSSEGDLHIHIHSPQRPVLEDDSWFIWEPISDLFLSAAPQPVEPQPNGGGESHDRSRPAPRYDDPDSALKDYVTGSEGLFFTDRNGQKVYVGRKKGR